MNECALWSQSGPVDRYRLALLAAQISPELCRDPDTQEKALDLANNLLRLIDERAHPQPEPDPEFEAFLLEHTLSRNTAVPYDRIREILMGPTAKNQTKRSKKRLESIVCLILDRVDLTEVNSVPRGTTRISVFIKEEAPLLPRQVFELVPFFKQAMYRKEADIRKLFENMPLPSHL